MIYATWSEGFRRGGVNALPTGNCFYCETHSLLTYKPDEARNTEVGFKGSFGRGSSYTFTLYNIDWKSPQIAASTVTGGFDFVTNGNTARSRGVETELTVPLADSTKMTLGYRYTDAILTSGFTAGVIPDLVGISGNRLPGVSRQQATVAADLAGRCLHQQHHPPRGRHLGVDPARTRPQSRRVRQPAAHHRLGIELFVKGSLTCKTGQPNARPTRQHPHTRGRPHTLTRPWPRPRPCPRARLRPRIRALLRSNNRGRPRLRR